MFVYKLCDICSVFWFFENDYLQMFLYTIVVFKICTLERKYPPPPKEYAPDNVNTSKEDYIYDFVLYPE